MREIDILTKRLSELDSIVTHFKNRVEIQSDIIKELELSNKELFYKLSKSDFENKLAIIELQKELKKIKGVSNDK